MGVGSGLQRWPERARSRPASGPGRRPEVEPDRGPAKQPGGAARGLLCLLLAAGLLASGCSLRRLAINTLADSLAASGDVYASDDDPELVRDATPFALKTIEGLLAEAPDHPGLLLAACRGFTQYAYAFVESDAEVVEGEDYRQARRLRERALKLYLRGRGYGLRGLDGVVAGSSRRLLVEPEAAAAAFGPREVPLLYWTGAAWGGAISLGKDRPELVANLPAVKALMERALALEPGYERGAIHEAMIVFEALGPAFGGSTEAAREHFQRAVKLSGGAKASPYVTYAQQVAVPAQDRRQFRELLERALAVDPDAEPALRLANLIAQRRARALLDREDELFLEPLGSEGGSEEGEERAGEGEGAGGETSPLPGTSISAGGP